MLFTGLNLISFLLHLKIIILSFFRLLKIFISETIHKGAQAKFWEAQLPLCSLPI